MTILDRVMLIDPPDVLGTLRADIARDPVVLLWAYTVEPKFFRSVFIDPRPQAQTRMIVDYRQRDRLRREHIPTPSCQIRTWVKNRTQHDKTIICAMQRIVWITTSNLHFGSFNLANNRALRITESKVFDLLYERHAQDWKLSTELFPTEESQ